MRYCTYTDAFQHNLPGCKDIICQRPVLPIRGSLQLSTNPLQQTFSYNESISFFCISGYNLHGPTVKYCRKNGDFERGFPHCTAKGKQESASFTVGFLSGCAVGIFVNSTVIIVIFFLRRRFCQQKKYKGGNHQIDDKDHEYSGIEYQSSDRENHNTNVLEPPVSVSDGPYTETTFDSDDKDHQYTSLNEIKMNQLTGATADRSIQL